MWNVFIFLNKADPINWIWSCEAQEDMKLSGKSPTPHSDITRGSVVREIKC